METLKIWMQDFRRHGLTESGLAPLAKGKTEWLQGLLGKSHVREERGRNELILRSTTGRMRTKLVANHVQHFVRLMVFDKRDLTFGRAGREVVRQ